MQVKLHHIEHDQRENASMSTFKQVYVLPDLSSGVNKSICANFSQELEKQPNPAQSEEPKIFNQINWGHAK